MRTFAISKYLEVCREPPKLINWQKNEIRRGHSWPWIILGFRILYCTTFSIHKRKKNEVPKKRWEECFAVWNARQPADYPRDQSDLFFYALATVWCFGWRETGTRLSTHGLFRACNWLLVMSFMFQKSGQNKGYLGHGHLILIFARNYILNLKSLPGKKGTCAKSSAFEESASLKGKGNISPKILSSYSQVPWGTTVCIFWLAWLSPLGFRSYVWKMSSGWYSLIIKLKLGVMWIFYGLLR